MIIMICYFQVRVVCMVCGVEAAGPVIQVRIQHNEWWVLQSTLLFRTTIPLWSDEGRYFFDHTQTCKSSTVQVSTYRDSSRLPRCLYQGRLRTGLATALYNREVQTVQLQVEGTGPATRRHLRVQPDSETAGTVTRQGPMCQT